ncbi:hypothetical protein HER39_14885 [Arthrobacter deserti]|uniref:Dimethylamine monooxygenase subunit DmmA-like C-terminal domain-containing protein n=1 Tax=Arthrobacter deserti TaxID=1742687 RepID=A0ABX1JVL6_9MICC|nr:hypothetical protein [Arthrobacter deserti]
MDYRDLAQRLSRRSRVGDRVAVAGPEVGVLSVRASLLAVGFLRTELVLHATGMEEIRVRCAHCRTARRFIARPGAAVPCGRCGYRLIVHHHFSPTHAAYLGFRIDAEDHD